MLQNLPIAGAVLSGYVERARLGFASAQLRNEEGISENAPPWAHLVYAALKHVRTARGAEYDAPLFAMLPYCLHSMPGRMERCVVHRGYKPLGNLSSGWATYETATDQHMSFEEFKALREAGVVDEHGYLHDDATSPRIGGRDLRAYRRKLRLMIAQYLNTSGGIHQWT